MIITATLFKDDWIFGFTITLIVGLLASPFIIPHNLMDEFIIGPSLWLFFLTGILFFYSSIYLFLSKNSLVKCGLNRVDFIITVLFVFIVLRKLFLWPPLINDKILLLGCLLAIYFVIKLFFQQLSKLSLEKANVVVTISFISGLLINCLYGLLQLTGVVNSFSPYFKITGPFNNPGRYANYLAALLPFCISTYFFWDKSRKKYIIVRNLSGIAIFASVVVLPPTLERSAWLGISISTICIIIYRYKSIFNKFYKKIAVKLTAAALLILSLLWMYKMKPTSALSRLTVWKISIPMALENIWVGIGYGNFEYSYDKFQADYFKKNQTNKIEVLNAGIVRYPYNIFLQILCEEGIIGLLLCLAFLVYLVDLVKYNVVQNQIMTSLQLGSLSGCLSIFICGCTSYPFDILPLLVILFIYFGIISGTFTDKKAIRIKGRFANKYGTGVIAAFLMICSIGIFYSSITKYKACILWKQVYNRSTRINEIDLAYPVLKNNADFMDFYSRVLIDQKRYMTAIKIINSSNYLMMYPSQYINLAHAYAAFGKNDSAELCFKTATDMLPNSFHCKYELAKFYFSSGQNDKGYNLVDNILSMKVKIQSQAVDSIISWSKQITSDSSYKKFKKIIQ